MFLQLLEVHPAQVGCCIVLLTMVEMDDIFMIGSRLRQEQRGDHPVNENGFTLSSQVDGKVAVIDGAF